MTHLPKNSVLLVFTDDGTKDLDMENQIIQLRDEKQIKIIMIMAPEFRGGLLGGLLGHQSVELYKRLSEGRFYNMKNFKVEDLIKDVEYIVDNC